MNKNRTWCGKCDTTMDIAGVVETRRMANNPHKGVVVRGRLVCGHTATYVTTEDQLGEFRVELLRNRVLA